MNFKLGLALALIMPASLVGAQEPKRANIASSPAARFQIIEASFGSSRYDELGKSATASTVSESKVIILLDSQEGETWVLNSDSIMGYKLTPLLKQSHDDYLKEVNRRIEDYNSARK